MLAWIFTVVYGVGIGFLAHWLIGRFLPVDAFEVFANYASAWAIGGGAIIGMITAILVRLSSQEYIDDPELSTFFVFVAAAPVTAPFFVITSFSLGFIPYIIVFAYAIACGGAIGYGAFSLLGWFWFEWGVIGGIVACITSLYVAIRIGIDEFAEFPDFGGFFAFIVKAPFYALIYSIRHLFFTILAILGISIIIGLFGWIFG